MAIVNGKISNKYNFKVEEFEASKDSFHLRIGSNIFSETGFSLNLTPKKGDDAISIIRGQVSFSDIVPWPVTLTSPGVMGKYLKEINSKYRDIISSLTKRLVFLCSNIGMLSWNNEHGSCFAWSNFNWRFYISKINFI